MANFVKNIRNVQFELHAEADNPEWDVVMAVTHVEGEFVLRGELRIKAAHPSANYPYTYQAAIFREDDCELTKSDYAESNRLDEVVQYSQGKAFELFTNTMNSLRKSKARERREQKELQQRSEALRRYIYEDSPTPCTCK